MKLNEYTQYDGLGLAELVRSKEVTPEELVQTALAAIERVNPRINAVVAPMRDEARATLTRGLPQGPFTGVPFLLKDAVLHAANVPCEMGSRLAAGLVMPQDSELMARFRQAGIVPVGRTNTPEMAFNVTTEPLFHGPSRNPWNPEYSTGGSSGGSAAAVQAGIVPLAHANDGGGSIRIPASLCGVFGLKPTRGRTPIGPDAADGLNGLGIEHVVSRSVRDSAAMLDATLGPDVGEPYQIQAPERPYLKELEREPGRLRIALSRVPPSGVPVSPECVAAVEDAARLCQELGHEVVEASPQFDASGFNHANTVIWSSNLAVWVGGMAAATGRSPEETLEATTWATVQYGRGLTATELQLAFATVNQVTRAVGRFFTGYDLLLTPTVAVPPYKLGVVDANVRMTAEEWIDRIFTFCPFTALFNFTGQPAMSVPLYWSDGLPIGVQFAGRWGDEATLFRLAAQLERARPWASRRPPVHAAL
ncbi:amidase [Archangium violaceum]|uniref:amidase n=1 Tax=Archangium violaceum TaxID=83451 RepID=UPI0019503ACD|nr:amidase [Archangium violaceum]QRN97591.1 amidase [Archangium violaceum]